MAQFHKQKLVKNVGWKYTKKLAIVSKLLLFKGTLKRKNLSSKKAGERKSIVLAG
jgi:hypothetical protein